MKKFAALLLALMMVLSLVPMATAEAPIEVRYGTHWTAGWDPNQIDEATGTYSMTDEADRQLHLKAEAAVLEKHNVKLVHVQYSQDVRSELVLSVLAGNPLLRNRPYVEWLREHRSGSERSAAAGRVRLHLRRR